jgi:ankyrin repeat protein
MALFFSLPTDLKREVCLFLKTNDLNKLNEDFLLDKDDLFWKMKVFSQVSPMSLSRVIDDIFSSISKIIHYGLVEEYMRTTYWTDDLIFLVYNVRYDLDKIVNYRDARGESMIFSAYCMNCGFKNLLQYNPNLNLQNNDGNTVLHILSSIPSREEDVKLLISKGVDINIKNNIGNTPLMRSIYVINNHNNIRILLQAGANPNIKTKHGFSCLMELTRIHNSYLIFKDFLQYGADVHYTDDENDTVLSWLCIYAAKFNNENILDLLIKAGSNVNHTGHKGFTPLLYALYNVNNLSFINKLLEAGADVNTADEDGNSPLLYAAQHSSIDIVSILLTYKNINLYHKNNKGFNAYDLSVQTHGPDAPISILMKGFIRKRKLES